MFSTPLYYAAVLPAHLRVVVSGAFAKRMHPRNVAATPIVTAIGKKTQADIYVSTRYHCLHSARYLRATETRTRIDTSTVHQD